MNFDARWNFWASLLRSPSGEGEGGGTGGESGQAGADATGGEGNDGSAGADDSSPSLLSRAAESNADNPPQDGEKKSADGAEDGAADDGQKQDPPAAFDPAAITLPEGVTLEEDLTKSFAEVLGDEKLTPQERGQKLVDMHLDAVSKITEQLTKQLYESGRQQFKDMNAEWEKQTRALPEFKDNPEAEVGKIFQVLKTLGAGEEFFTAVTLTGAGNHPAIMQVLHRLVQPFLEGGPVGGEGKKEPSRQLGSAIYKSANP